jgi:hypothetical protein
MTYEIFTYGNGEILKGVFDAIAMCLNGVLAAAVRGNGQIRV